MVSPARLETVAVRVSVDPAVAVVGKVKVAEYGGAVSVATMEPFNWITTEAIPLMLSLAMTVAVPLCPGAN